MSTQRGKSESEPIVLVDGGDDGLDEQGWVERTVSSDEALRVMEYSNPDPECCVITLEGTQFLRPDDPDRPDDEQRWLPCQRDTPGAREFWWLKAYDRADVEGAA